MIYADLLPHEIGNPVRIYVGNEMILDIHDFEDAIRVYQTLRKKLRQELKAKGQHEAAALL